MGSLKSWYSSNSFYTDPKYKPNLKSPLYIILMWFKINS
jgi:hypothetical protein